jgi:hypothetical protein
VYLERQQCCRIPRILNGNSVAGTEKKVGQEVQPLLRAGHHGDLLGPALHRAVLSHMGGDSTAQGRKAGRGRCLGKRVTVARYHPDRGIGPCLPGKEVIGNAVRPKIPARLDDVPTFCCRGDPASPGRQLEGRS